MKKLILTATLLLVAACSGGGDHNDADETFAREMVPHHQQAVQMTDLVPQAQASPEVQDLARRIAAAQEPEITRMKGWLDDWGVEHSHGDMDHGDMDGMDDMGAMQGMASASDLDRLATLKGEEFDALFLQLMTAHHEGAVTMARTELADGQDAEAKDLARDIIATQQAEIALMKGLQG